MNCLGGPLLTPVPSATSAGAQPSLPRRRDEFRAWLDTLRDDGYATDPGAFPPALACIATPWTQPRFPSAITCLGPPAAITAGMTLIRHVLALAVQSGSTPSQIITGAAAALAPDLS